MPSGASFSTIRYFDDDQYGHSLWFDKCCGDERTVDNLGADFDNIWLKMMPRKTLNYVPVLGNETAEADAPNGVRVMQVDRNTVALKQIEEPKKPPTIPATTPFAERTPSVDRNELPVKQACGTRWTATRDGVTDEDDVFGDVHSRAGPRPSPEPKSRFQMRGCLSRWERRHAAG